MRGPSLLNITFSDFPAFFNERKRMEIHDEKMKKIKLLLADLTKEQIDISEFQNHLDNEMERQLKKYFGFIFFIFTGFFTLLSYSIVICNSILDWGIPEYAIIALVIEIPIQFIGILYIIANHFYPKR